MDTQPKRIIVTGASGNLGKAVTRVLHKFGHEILAVTGSKQLPSDCHAYVKDEQPIDLRDEIKSAAYVEQVSTQFGAIDAAVLLVGGYAGGKLPDTTRKSIDEQIALNFSTAYNMVHPLLGHFADSGGGQFFLISSRPAIDAKAGAENVAYSLSKGMVLHLGELINTFGKNKHIRASVIVPSTIDTPENRQAMPGSDFAKWVKAEDIGEAIAFLLTEPAKAIRESVLKIYNEA